MNTSEIFLIAMATIFAVPCASWRLSRTDAALICWLLQTKARIMTIFANVLLDKQVISNDTFTALLLMAVASTLRTIQRVAPVRARQPGLRGRG